MAQTGQTGLPGLTLPLDYTPDTDDHQVMFPRGLDWKVVERGACKYVAALDILCTFANILTNIRFHTLREIFIMRMINDLTEEEGWHWREKISRVRWVHAIKAAFKRNKNDVTSSMLKWVIDERRWRAFLFKQSGFTLAFDAIFKSDTVIGSELHQKFKQLVDPFEQKMDEKDSSKSWKIVDPARYPLAYGITRVVHNETIHFDNCLNAIGKGFPLFLCIPGSGAAAADPLCPKVQTMPINPGPPPQEYDRWGREVEPKPYSWCDERSQLLPCDLTLKNGQWCITSYINGLHPRKDQQLYITIQEIINQCMQPWGGCLAQWSARWNRISHSRAVFQSPLGRLVVPECLFDDRALDWIDWKVDKWRQRRSIKLPEPAEFDSSKIPQRKVNLTEKFGSTGIQVIVQLESVFLKPRKELGEGWNMVASDHWHLQGHLNEHICATAVYCFGQENLARYGFQFRQRSDESQKVLNSREYEHQPVWADVCREVFGYEMDGDDLSVYQCLGWVPIPERRLVAFPNTMETRSIYSLEDVSKPGRCKLLTLSLVDPHMRIISTSKALPQQPELWAPRQQLINTFLRSKLPQELVDMVQQYLSEAEDGPLSPERHKLITQASVASRRMLEKNQKKIFGLPKSHNPWRTW
ncbi:uncharacterized protein N7496_006383, partial [Penicillium cataractarum]